MGDTKQFADEEDEVCGESYDHDLDYTYEGPDGTQWSCRRCGAEGWDDEPRAAMGGLQYQNQNGERE